MLSAGWNYFTHLVIQTGKSANKIHASIANLINSKYKLGWLRVSNSSRGSGEVATKALDRNTRIAANPSVNLKVPGQILRKPYVP